MNNSSFNDRFKYEYALQSGQVSQNKLTTIVCMCGVSLAMDRTCPDVSSRTSPQGSAKYLGIAISDNMDWDQHISEISSKATKTLGFLRGNLAFAPRSTKEVAYKTLVRPKLEPVCSTHLEPLLKTSY